MGHPIRNVVGLVGAILLVWAVLMLVLRLVQVLIVVTVWDLPFFIGAAVLIGRMVWEGVPLGLALFRRTFGLLFAPKGDAPR